MDVCIDSRYYKQIQGGPPSPIKKNKKTRNSIRDLYYVNDVLCLPHKSMQKGQLIITFCRSWRTKLWRSTVQPGCASAKGNMSSCSITSETSGPSALALQQGTDSCFSPANLIPWPAPALPRTWLKSAGWYDALTSPPAGFDPGCAHL